MLNPPRRPAELDIANLLCTSEGNTEIPQRRQHSPIYLSKDPNSTAGCNSTIYNTQEAVTQEVGTRTVERSAGRRRRTYKDSTSIQVKRRRTTAMQAEILNKVFQHTVFPSSQLRIELGQQLGMKPRAVQIWFQNRRQAVRLRERQYQEKHQERVQSQLPSPLPSPTSFSPSGTSSFSM